MAPNPRAPNPLKKYRVKITDRRGKSQAVLSIDWQATSPKEATLAVKQFILAGKFEAQEVVDEDKRPALGLRR